MPRFARMCFIDFDRSCSWTQLSEDVISVRNDHGMRHQFETEGFGVRLRPVRLEDAGFIVWLRNLEHTRGKLGDSAVDVTSQEAWLKTYFEREGDYYFIAETLSGIPMGTHGLYGVCGASAEAGRLIIRPDVP